MVESLKPSTHATKERTINGEGLKGWGGGGGGGGGEQKE